MARRPFLAFLLRRIFCGRSDEAFDEAFGLGVVHELFDSWRFAQGGGVAALDGLHEVGIGQHGLHVWVLRELRHSSHPAAAGKEVLNFG